MLDLENNTFDEVSAQERGGGYTNLHIDYANIKFNKVVLQVHFDLIAYFLGFDIGTNTFVQLKSSCA